MKQIYIFLIILFLISILLGYLFFNTNKEKEYFFSVYYYSEVKDRELHGDIFCGKDALVKKEISTPVPYTLFDAVNYLIREGVSDEDKEQGLSSEFPHKEFLLLDVKKENNRATLSFSDVPGFTSGGACRMSVLKSQIEETARAFPGVEEVYFEPETLFEP